MPLFNRTKKKLEEERQQRLKLENEVAEHRRREDLQDREMERTRKQLENSRLAREQLEKQEEERQDIERKRRQSEEKKRQREEQQRQEKQKKIMEASPETLRSLRDLIREKYRLDVEIWGLRGARGPDRWIVEQKMERADTVMQEILAMTMVWEYNRDNSNGLWQTAEWERVQDICGRLHNGGIRFWADKPLWSEARESGTYRH